MYSKISKLLFTFLLSLAFIAGSANAEGDRKESGNLDKVQGSPSRTYLNINNISTIINNDGISDIHPSGNSGLIFPKGSGKGAVFTSGLLWGALVPGDPQPRVGGTAYRTGLQPGGITNSGVPVSQLVPESNSADHVRIYRVRRDVYPGGPAANFDSEIADEGGTEASIRAQYELDWTQWPAQYGAPFDDRNGNGTYEPDADIPGVPGADQTIWFIANDVNPSKTTFLYGAQPLGIEVQATFWAYSQTGALGNMYFRKYKLINKSNTPFNEMYVSMWSDVDLGNSVDDFAGCDTTLSLGYVYNANANDAVYNPLPPPAIGFDFFQGPILDGVAGQDLNKNGIDDAEDFGIFDGKRVGPGKINLPMTSFYYFARGDASVVDPTQGDIAGSSQFYNFFQGRIGLTGAPFVDPNTNQPTTFALAGDPQTRTGWVDGQVIPADDRRIGSASGPFTMAPGDTQEVVVAEIAAGAIPGTDRLSAIGLLKFYDQQAQLAYDNFFDLPVAPPAPIVNLVELDQEIILDWGSNLTRVRETESSNAKGFAFEGYNVYQLPSVSADVSEGRRIATYDIVNGVGKIEDQFFDPATGVVAVGVRQFGNDTGIKRFIRLTRDELSGGTPLVNGKRYYYAVTAYNYNPDPAAVPNNLETPLAVITAVPHSKNPGVDFTDPGTAENVQHQGTSDAEVEVVVVDPTKLTGHTYEVFFNQQHYYLDASGEWKTTNFPDSIGKVGDVSPSTLEPAAVYGTNPGTIDINLVLNLDSPTGAWVDGVTLTLPAGLTLVEAPVVHAGGGDVTPEINGNVITYGLVNGEQTLEGVFHGGEVITLVVQSFTPPLGIDYVIHDDGYEANGNPIDAVGTANITEIGNYFVTQDHWNVRDVTTGQVVLEDQTIYDGVDIYAGVLGPGGSSKLQDPNVGAEENVIVDGLQFRVNGSFAAPIEYNTISMNEGSTSTVGTGSSPSATRTTLANYTLYGIPSSKAIDGFGIGTNDLNQLQQDYEIRYTGILDTVVENGRTIIKVVEGGQMATVFSGPTADYLANHPLNPNPGTNAPFLVRIPFEVWNKDLNKQVNLIFRDREQSAAADPFRVWNSEQRVYAIIVNTDYSETTVIPGTPDPLNANATWIVVFYSTRMVPGDILTISYANPIQPGVDTYSFTAPAPTFSAENAKQDVEKINVFPNPYYGVNSQELNKYERFVTFSHLPQKATIRIFNLAGVMVKTIEKNSNDQFMRWDLANESGLPVASGLYIAYIDMPDLGTTKILKLAIIQEQQILDRF